MFVGSLSSLIPDTSVRKHYKAQYSKYLYHSNVCTVSLSIVCAVQDKVTCRRVLQYCTGDHVFLLCAKEQPFLNRDSSYKPLLSPIIQDFPFKLGKLALHFDLIVFLMAECIVSTILLGNNCPKDCGTIISKVGCCQKPVS